MFFNRKEEKGRKEGGKRKAQRKGEEDERVRWVRAMQLREYPVDLFLRVLFAFYRLSFCTRREEGRGERRKREGREGIEAPFQNSSR